MPSLHSPQFPHLSIPDPDRDTRRLYDKLRKILDSQGWGTEVKESQEKSKERTGKAVAFPSPGASGTSQGAESRGLRLKEQM